MNTVHKLAQNLPVTKIDVCRYGWATFIAAGAGAYYFAKRSVNADKRARFEEDMKRQRLRAEAREAREAEWNARGPINKEGKDKPQGKSNQKTAPEQAPEIEAQKPDMAAQYLATKPYRSTKGDRFS